MKSSTLDKWNYKLLDKFKKKGGNAVVNAIYEAKLPSALKPNEQTETYTLEQFIRAKYIDRKWYSEKGSKKSKKVRWIYMYYMLFDIMSRHLYIVI